MDFDLAIVGAGIVGLAHAWHASRAGLRVVVLERDGYAVGASIRNFGHICTTAQDDIALEYALRARQEWLTLAREAGIPVRAEGTVVVARRAEELAVLEQFAAARGADQVTMLDPAGASDRLGFTPPGLLGAAHLPLDLRVDSPTAVPALAAHLAALGVDVRFGVNVTGVESGLVHTTRGEVRAERVIVAVGHDVDRFFPDLAAEHGVTRCRLRMLEADAPRGVDVAPGVLTGLSLLRYDGFARTAAAAELRAAIAADAPELVARGVNLMFTQRLPHSEAAGRLVLGDTHHYEDTESPFEDEESDQLLLEEFRRLLGADELRVRRRWRGVYASSPQGPYLVADPLPGVTAVSVTSGIGMTTALGLAASVLP
ncbi:TIGR03364 family FAD-dependent oxidoreductase [Gryllotalpicola ginsengisoli]|uniref:TIGR03364 family FAD-dependent oxidoreductase n=1 Tax=Gryllotalpicola ginsengisoli TaxID=444608 RepID=UPI0003B76E01|nr:TIGR03364 family FAD-dependent oxidoreductase [Gryllotalpicola ginsengisoli]